MTDKSTVDYSPQEDKHGELSVKLNGRTISIDREKYILAHHWLVERHKIWFKKDYQGLERPWTLDPTLDKWKFTNAYRKLDKGTRYILPYLESNEYSELDKYWNILRYRLFNNRHSHKATGGFTGYSEFDYREWYTSLRTRWEEGTQVLCQSHNTCTYNGFPGGDKIERVCLVAKEAHSKARDYFYGMMAILGLPEDETSKMEKVFKIVKSHKGYGPFLSYEVLMDLSYVYPKLLDAKEWANVGPGASRGLNHIFKGHKAADELDLLRVLVHNFPFGISLTNHDFANSLVLLKMGTDTGDFDLRTAENMMCELSKYIKILTKTGRSFSGTYRPSKD